LVKLAEIAGVERKIHVFAMDLPHSDACFVQAYQAETSEAFCDGHNGAFAVFGKVPCSILYDNTKLAVARIMGDGYASARGCSAYCSPIALCRPVRSAGKGQR
jgi:transposase